MTKAEAINLYNGIKEYKNGNMDRETLYPFIKLRLKLKELADEFEVVRNEFTEQTKPEDIKEGDDTTEWNNNFQHLILKWLNEEFEAEPVFTFEEAVDYCVANDSVGSLQDEIIRLLSK